MAKETQKAISEFFSEHINEIDIQTERVLSKLSDKKDENLNEIETINSLRETCINKARELEKFNLENSSDISKFKGCILFPNVEMQVFKKELGDLNIQYANKLGILVTFVLVDMYNTLKIIQEAVVNNTAIKQEDFKLFRDSAQVSICIDLINKMSSIDQFIDLTVPENNKLQDLNLQCSQIKKIGDSDLDFLPKFINVNEINELGLAHDSLVHVPSGIFQNLNGLQKLSISSKNIEFVWSFNFKPLSNLTELEIYATSLRKIEKNAFNGLNNLKFLNLNENQIKKIDSETFNGLGNLESLWLDQNCIEVIRTDTFIHLKNLKLLYLCMNKIDQLEANCFNGLENLKIIRLMDNSMQLDIDETSFDACTNLEVLDLDGNNFDSCETTIFRNLKNVKFLNLRASQTKKIEFLQNFTKLEVLDIAQTELTNEQLNSVNFCNLRYLVSSFERVPKFGPNFKSLQALSIEDITCFERNCFDNLVNLEFMKIEIKYAEIMDTFNEQNFKFYNNFKYFKLRFFKKSESWFQLYESKKKLFLNLFDSKEEVVVDLKEKYGLIRIKTKDCKSHNKYFENFLKASPTAIEGIFTCFYC